MKRKILFVAFIAFFVFVGSVSAQAAFSHYSEETFDAINATPEQRKKLLEIQRNAEEQIAVVKKDPTLTSGERREKLKEISRQRGEAYSATLRKSQMVRVNRLFREYREQLKEKQEAKK